MVGIGGIEVFLQLRADPLTAAIPVMFLTANPSIVKVHLPDYAARNAALLPKPFNITVLNALVQRLIAHASV
jgi:CheY-like chemotaxis protein